MQYLASNTLSWGKSNLCSVLEMSEEVGDSAIEEAISPYLKFFDENTPSTAGNFPKETNNFFLIHNF
jgi:hypothetical protein